MWFQQDSATCHTGRVTKDFLRGEFGEHLIRDRSIARLDRAI